LTGLVQPDILFYGPTNEPNTVIFSLCGVGCFYRIRSIDRTIGHDLLEMVFVVRQKHVLRGNAEDAEYDAGTLKGGRKDGSRSRTAGNSNHVLARRLDKKMTDDGLSVKDIDPGAACVPLLTWVT
jgi:hypothetical protein